jgi:type III restriction enzyme
MTWVRGGVKPNSATKFRDPGEEIKLYLFGQLKTITSQWLYGNRVTNGNETANGNGATAACLHCTGDTYPAQLGACNFNAVQ